MSAQPIVFEWQGDAMVPASRHWQRQCDERFVVGKCYTMDEIHARSHASHAHYFAVLHEIWQSLPEHIAPQFGNAEILRKHALIRTGFHTKVEHACRSAAEAKRLAAVIRPYDAYQIVTIDNERPTVVTVYHALSQDHRSMDKATFRDSKEKVLDWCADLIGADRDDVRRAA